MNVLARSFPRVAAAVMGCTAALILVGALGEIDHRISRLFDRVTLLHGREVEATEHLFQRLERLERHTGLHNAGYIPLSTQETCGPAPAQASPDPVDVELAELVDEEAGK